MSKGDYRLISQMLARGEHKTRCSKAWRALYSEHGLGRLVDNKMFHWSREDVKKWQALLDDSSAAHQAARAGADRTAISIHTANEKLSNVSVQKERLLCHSINSPLYLTSGEQPVHPEVEYRVHYQALDINRYAACIIIENLEAYVYCQHFNWPELPETLVLYRGHDKAAQTLQQLLKQAKQNLGVYVFPDTDPAGLSIAMSTVRATHIIAPEVKKLDRQGLLRDRFATQLQRQPNLQLQARQFSVAFQYLVADVLQTGTAVSQEWICANQIPLQLTPL